MATTDDATYWLIAIPNWAASGRAPRQGSSKTERELDEERILTRRELDMKTGKMGALYTFHLPKLRVGTLDSLMTLTDELHKLDAQIFQTVRRVQTLYGDLKGEAEDLLVNAMSCERYAENFAWNEALYRVTLPLPELKQRIEMDMNAIADELHKKTGKFADVQQELSALERKQTGSLLVKPLGPLVPPEKLVEGAFLSTLLVVVPVAKRKDFLASYELLEEMAAKRHRERVEALRESGVEEEPVNPLEQLELSDAEDEAAPGEGDAGDDAEQEDIPGAD